MDLNILYQILANNLNIFPYHDRKYKVILNIRIYSIENLNLHQGDNIFRFLCINPLNIHEIISFYI